MHDWFGCATPEHPHTIHGSRIRSGKWDLMFREDGCVGYYLDNDAQDAPARLMQIEM